ncbi:hypothetical protein F1880_006678 [Penicillium rolfsii]|nr:hypothetical protein F1880_006678 [Penicillium rolfsii]
MSLMLFDVIIRAVLSFGARKSRCGRDPVVIVGLAMLVLAVEVFVMVAGHVLHVCRETGLVLTGALELTPGRCVQKSSIARRQVIDTLAMSTKY